MADHYGDAGEHNYTSMSPAVQSTTDLRQSSSSDIIESALRRN